MDTPPPRWAAPTRKNDSNVFHGVTDMSTLTPSIAAMAVVLSLFTSITQAEPRPDKYDNDAAQQSLDTYQEAMSYLLGRNGKVKSEEKAAELFQSLAEKNWSSAQQMLGYLYYEGKGVEKNALLAYKWLSLAVRNNPRTTEDIQSRRRQLLSQIPPDRRQQVNQWIAEWRPES